MSELIASYTKVKFVVTEHYCEQVLSLLKQGHVLLITSEGFTKRGQVDDLLSVIGESRVTVIDKVKPNPEKSDLKAIFESLKNIQFTNVVAIGGGSVLDSAKVVSAMLSYPNQTLDDLLNRSEVTNNLNLIAIPTTAGTGAEVTPFATVWERETSSKFSLYGVLPSHGILCPRLTLTLPIDETLYPALDALSHALESLWNKNRTIESKTFAEQAIQKICHSLPVVLATPENLLARQDIQIAATLAGMAIAITKTALAHAISYPLTLRYGVPHGLACSFTLGSIINEVGREKLSLSSELVDKIVNLLAELSLEKEISKFVDCSYLLENFNPTLDKSRAGNFILDIQDDLVNNVIKDCLTPSNPLSLKQD